MLRAITSTAAAVRLEAARQFLAQLPPSAEAVIVGATRGAADDFVRGVAARAGATFGLSRFGLAELAARAAASHLAGGRGGAPTRGGAAAVAAGGAFGA